MVEPYQYNTGVIVLSDTHINSTTAVCVPTINLDDGGTYRASRFQRALWDDFLAFRDEAAKLTTGLKRLLILNGDIGELDTKRRSTQLITTNKATISRMTVDTLEPFLEIADAVLIVRGTMAHSGKASWLEEAIAKDIDISIPERNTGAASHYHFHDNVGGQKFDIAHHGRMGGVPWTEKHAGVRLAAETFWNYSKNGRPLPDIVIRSHNHRRADSGRNFPFLAMFTPAWQGITEYGYRIGKENSLSDIGGDVFLCGPKGHEWIPIDYKPHTVGRQFWQALQI
jgi:hypothetical protein